MKKACVFTGFALVTIALNSDRAIVLAATTGNPFSNPMAEDIYSDSTAKNPSSDSMTGEVTQLLGSSFSPSTSESSLLGESSLTIALNSTEGASNSTDSVNSTEGASDSTDSVNSTEMAFNSAPTLNLSQESNTTNNLNLIETSNSIPSDLEPVPEPLTIVGTGLALGFGVLLNREHSKRQKATKHKSE